MAPLYDGDAIIRQTGPEWITRRFDFRVNLGGAGRICALV